jgi:hypothetical protein
MTPLPGWGCAANIGDERQGMIFTHLGNESEFEAEHV